VTAATWPAYSSWLASYGGVLWGVCLLLVLIWLPLQFGWWKLALALSATALPLVAVWRRARSLGSSRGEQDRKDGPHVERFAANLDLCSEALRETAGVREALRELTAVLSMLPEKLALAMPSPSASSYQGRAPEVALRKAAESSSVPREAGRQEERMVAPAGEFAAGLIRAWKRYFDEGDGRFTAVGFQCELEREGLMRAHAFPGSQLGAGDDVLAVSSDDGDVYLLPSFTTSVHALSNRFEVPKGLPRDAKIHRLVRPAVGRKSIEGLEIITRGAVE
jgi:hypothetical protein